MFGVIVFDPDQLRWDSLLPALEAWVRDAGGLAAFGLAIWGLAYVLGRLLNIRPVTGIRSSPAQAKLFGLALASAAAAYGFFFFLLLVEGKETVVDEVTYGKKVTWTVLRPNQMTALTVGGALALLAVLIPILFWLGRLRFRRIWAVARLSMKETVRQRVLWVFSFLILVILFASWFIESDKPEYQLRNYVWVVDWSMTILLLLAASLLAAFSIPADVKSQTIHTVVTKPVERFEIVLGRFLGYTLLMTMVLAVVTSLGLAYLFRNINEDAKKENYKARVPLYGNIHYVGTESEDRGTNVGREITHRSYISGPNRNQPVTQWAVWTFPELPARLAERPDGVSCEFGFDVYRTHKGEVGKGVFCTFRFVTGRCPFNERTMEPGEPVKAFVERLEKEGKGAAEIKDLVAEKFGYFEEPSKTILDFRTQEIVLPQGLFKNALAAAEEDEGGEGRPRGPALRAIVNVNPQSHQQLVGVAKQDLYLLDDERSFEENFFKAAVGLWARLALVIGLAVAFSTYLSGIISWFCTMFVFCLGLFKEFLHQVALGVNDGGGPMESLYRLANRQSVAAQIELNPFTQVGLIFDEGFRFLARLLMRLIPDVNRFDLSRYVSAGFDVPWSDVLMLDNLLRMLGFVVPCFILAFYLIRYREIANPT